MEALEKAGYLEPTPIQAGLIPRALPGVDLMGQARTGTGKTAAFAIPILERLKPAQEGPRPAGPGPGAHARAGRAGPRRSASSWPTAARFTRVAVYGGKPIREQIEKLARGAEIIVGTPGRVLDLHGPRHARSSATCASSCSTRPTGCSTSASGPTSRRSSAAARSRGRRCCLSATVPPPVERLARAYMRDPEMLELLAQGHGGRDDRAVLLHGRSASGSSICWCSCSSASSRSRRSSSAAPSAAPTRSTAG